MILLLLLPPMKSSPKFLLLLPMETSPRFLLLLPPVESSATPSSSYNLWRAPHFPPPPTADGELPRFLLLLLLPMESSLGTSFS